MRRQENSFGFWEILFIVVIIIVFIASLGQVAIPLEKEIKVKDEDKNDLTKLKVRHKKLKKLISKKEALNINLNKKFKRIYFGVRFVLASLFVSYNALMYFAFNINKLGDLLNWNQFALIIMALFSFIAFGTLANVRDFIQNIKMRLESKTFNKYVDITEQIETHKEEAIKLTATITKGQINISKQSVVEDNIKYKN
ncbi:hypothetical protein N9438_01745 [Flavobacteriaceae bacterium]|nr:hypothetical protein [Flavobacteriaceae bacterium]